LPSFAHAPDRRIVITVLGVAQILSWGTSFYFPAVFAPPILEDTGWPLGFIVGGTSVGLLIAGLVSPQVGRLIDRHGGRPVLLASPVLYAAGLIGVGSSPTLAVYLASWVLIGLGMGAGLYDAAFAALGRMYGSAARNPIANLTLFGGFSSTICWPLSAFMIDHIGWREACFAYAALHLLVSLPLQALVLPNAERKIDPPRADDGTRDPGSRFAARIPREGAILGLLALILSLTAGIGAIVLVHLLIFLEARGVAPVAAVALGTLFGPAQVSARVVERLFGARYHPIWTMVGACALMAIGLTLLSVHAPMLALVILIYGAGYGVSWIGRGTLPLALFGSERFPRLMGKLAFPSLIVQAIAPSAGALLIEAAGTDIAIATLTALAIVNLALIGALWALSRKRPR
jgi:predicted MFS family arabinose efflux permease